MSVTTARRMTTRVHQNVPSRQRPRLLGYTPAVAAHHHDPPPRMHLVRQRFDATEVVDF